MKLKSFHSIPVLSISVVSISFLKAHIHPLKNGAPWFLKGGALHVDAYFRSLVKRFAECSRYGFACIFSVGISRMLAPSPAHQCAPLTKPFQDNSLCALTLCMHMGPKQLSYTWKRLLFTQGDRAVSLLLGYTLFFILFAFS